MIAVPFIYFSLLLLYIVKTKKTFDISAYLVCLYLVSGFFSILIDTNNLRSFDTKNYEIGIVPTFLYCFLLTLTIWPFYRFRSEKVVSINLNKPKLFTQIVYFYFACFLLIIISSYQTVFQILNGDLGELRVALSKGDADLDITAGSGVFKPFFMVANIFGGFSIIMLLFYFYSICFLNRTKWFNTMILVSSMSIIIIGILGIDRSKTVYWIITYGLMLILFWHYMAKKQRRKIFKVSGAVIGLALSYILAITLSRFGERDSGAEGGIISYAGQSFINFCFFFDKVDYREFSLQRIFPLFYKLFVDNGIEGSSDLNADISLKTGKSIAVFATFIGDIMVASGKLAIIAYCFIYSLIARKLINYRRKSELYFHQILVLVCLITVPLFGTFVYFYASFSRMIPLLFFVFYAFHLKVSLTKRVQLIADTHK